MNASADELNRRGIAHAQQREFRDAADCFRQALAADPNHVQAQIHLGNVLAELGDFQSAQSSFRLALNLDPNSVNAHVNLGVMLTRLQDHAAAAVSYQRAAELAPNNVTAHALLGTALSQLSRPGDAVAALRRASALAPQDPAIHKLLGSALLKVGDYAAALPSLEIALQREPNSSDVHFQIADALMALGRIAAALPHFDAALKLQPNDVERRCGYAAALTDFGRLPEALAHLNVILQANPGHPFANLGRSTVLLHLGDYAGGWPGYESQLKRKALHRFGYSQPFWDGSPLAGRTLLLEADGQGRGDTIQFARYAQAIKSQQQGRIILAVEPPLLPLLTGIAGPDVLLSQAEPRPPFDLWAPLMALPAILHHDASSFPAPIPYLKADEGRIEKWRRRLHQGQSSAPPAPAADSHVTTFKIGISWQGSKINYGDARRSFPLSLFAPLAKLPGVSLISLQKGDGTEQLSSLADFQVHTLGDDMDSAGAFLDTAAVMMNLDLVISADTALAHLAGALSRPVWLALAFVPDWRWTTHGDRTPWYPTMRIFRQPSPGNWPPVFDQMATTLQHLLTPSA